MRTKAKEKTDSQKRIEKANDKELRDLSKFTHSNKAARKYIKIKN